VFRIDGRSRFLTKTGKLSLCSLVRVYQSTVVHGLRFESASGAKDKTMKSDLRIGTALLTSNAKTVGTLFVLESLHVVRKGVHLELVDCFSNCVKSPNPKDD
jgi:hypothetical protein